MDETDRTLVRILQADGRTPVAELARTVGLSHAERRCKRVEARRGTTW
ncbi:AsnC family transcriptional regulator [Streptomyces sp. NPDC050433]